MRLSEVLEIPAGKFRVFGRDNFDGKYFFVKDCDFLNVAMGIAKRKKAEENQRNGKGNEIAATFYVADRGVNFYYGLEALPYLK